VIFGVILRGRIPKQQGLKLCFINDIVEVCKLRGRIPKQQGLKLGIHDAIPLEAIELRGRIPKQQGLKLRTSMRSSRRIRNFEGAFQNNKD